MLKIVLLILVCAGFLAVGPMLVDNQGLVIISFFDYIIEISLISAVIVLFSVWILVQIALYLISKFITVPKKAIDKLKNYSSKKSIKLAENSLVSYINGDYKSSQQLAEKSLSKDNYLIPSVLLAMCGVKTQDASLASKLEEFAQNNGKNSEASALSFIKAEQYMSNKEYTKAYAILDSLKQQNIQSHNYYEMLTKCCYELSLYNEFVSMNKVITNKYKQINDVYLPLFISKISEEISTSNSLEKLQEKINSLPKMFIDKVEVLVAIAKKFNDFNEQDTAFSYIEKNVKNSETVDFCCKNIATWERENLKLVALLEKLKNSKKIVTYELCSALANLYFNNGDFEKVIPLYQIVRQELFSKRDCLILAKVYENKALTSEALTWYKKALEK